MKNLKDYVNSKKTREFGLLLIPILAGLYLRAQTLKWYRLWAYDPYYFYRVATHIANGGSIFDRDPMIVTLSRRFIDDEPLLPLLWGYLSKITHIDTWTLGIYLPLVIFVLEVLVFYKLLKDAFNERVAFVSILFLALVPAHIYRSHAGGIWKDTLGSLFMLLFLHASVLIIKSDELQKREMLKYGLYLSVSLSLSIASFDGFGAFPAGVALYLILVPLFYKIRINEVFLETIMLLTLLMGYVLPTYHREQYALLPFVLLTAGALVAMLGYAAILRPALKSSKSSRLVYIVLLSTGVVFGLWITITYPPHFLENTSKMVRFLLSPLRYGASAQSMSNNLKLLFNTWFSATLVLVPFGVFYLLRNLRNRLSLLFLMWSAVLLFLGVSTIRLTYVMSFGIVTLAAMGIELFHDFLNSKLSDYRKTIALFIACLVIVAVPTLNAGKRYVSMPPYPPDYWMDALDWMGNHIGGSVVYNWWDWGYWLEAYGMKTVGDNGYQSGLTMTAYAQIVLSNYSDFSYLMNKYSKSIEYLSMKRRGKSAHPDYFIVSFDLLLKFNSVKNAYNVLVEKYNYTPSDVYLVILPLMSSYGSFRVYESGAFTLYLNGRDSKLFINGRSVPIRDIVFEKLGQNFVIPLNAKGVIAYINGNYAVVFNEEAFNSTLVQLLVYENTTEASMIWENGRVKVFEITT